jgi:hypothetical protein
MILSLAVSSANLLLQFFSLQGHVPLGLWKVDIFSFGVNCDHVPMHGTVQGTPCLSVMKIILICIFDLPFLSVLEVP